MSCFPGSIGRLATLIGVASEAFSRNVAVLCSEAGTGVYPDSREDVAAARCGESDAAKELLVAIRQFQRESGRTFPTWCEVLEVAKRLGCEKGEEPLSLTAAHGRFRALAD